MITIQDYLEKTGSTAKYPDAGTGSQDEIEYLGLGVMGEAGEIGNKIKKVKRGLPGDPTLPALKTALKGEIGDLLWYALRLSKACGYKPEECMQANIDKLEKRKAAGRIGGSGDDR